MGVGLLLYRVNPEVPDGAGEGVLGDVLEALPPLATGQENETLSCLFNLLQIYPFLGWGVPVQIFCNSVKSDSVIGMMSFALHSLSAKTYSLWWMVFGSAL